MSTLRTNTLQNAAGTKSVPVNTVVDGTAKAWVQFNGTGTVAIRQAFNVSSITDNGVGDYTVNFTSAMTDANYSFQLNAVLEGNNGVFISPFSQATVLSGSLQLASRNQAAALFDSPRISVAIFR